MRTTDTEPNKWKEWVNELRKYLDIHSDTTDTLKRDSKASNKISVDNHFGIQQSDLKFSVRRNDKMFEI
jgi:hypothetical protein